MGAERWRGKSYGAEERLSLPPGVSRWTSDVRRREERAELPLSQQPFHRNADSTRAGQRSTLKRSLALFVRIISLKCKMLKSFGAGGHVIC